MPWITDGQVAGEIDKSEVHQTREISKFLTKGDEQYLILVASKGMGKTTLMRLKREQLEYAHAGLTLIPSNSEMDIVSLPSSVHNSLYRALQDVSYWRALWETAIMISVIVSSKLAPEVVQRQRASRNASELKLPGTLAEDLATAFTGVVQPQKPSEILDILLKESSADFETFRMSGLGQLTYIFRDVIASGCAVFIDSLDQELEKQFPGDLDIWRAGQLGLMRAAWELNRQNRHVKVFVSVRQEAWASFVDPVRGNMTGSTLVIKYSASDLRKIFELAIRKNDGPYSIEEFFGFKTINNHYIDHQEDVFEFLRRHTLGVPRWLVILGGEVANIRDARGPIVDPDHLSHHERAVADTINKASAALARDYLESEMELFFQGCEPIKHVKLLLKPVQSTVLTLPNIQRLSERYTEASSLEGDDKILKRLSHPFCLLVNLGLIGYSELAPFSGESVIRFRLPYEFNWDYEDILPPSPETLYFLHPSLHQIAKESSRAFHYAGVKIANDRVLTGEDLDKINLRRFSIFVSYSSTDWEAGVSSLVESLEDTLNEGGEFVDIWLDRLRMEAARKYLSQMHKGNIGSTFMLFCASRNSVESGGVKHEVAERVDLDFKHRTQTLFTVIVDDLTRDDLPFGLQGDHILQLKPGNFKIADLAAQIVRRREEIRNT